MTPRSPAPPPVLDDWARRFAGTGLDARGGALVDGALAALRDALARPGRNRDAAFALLAADALLTYACEDAVAAADPEAELESLVARTAGVEPR